MAGAGLDVECISSVLELPIPEVKAVVDRYKNDTALLGAGIQEYLDSRTGIFQPEEGAGFVESTRRKTKKVGPTRFGLSTARLCSQPPFSWQINAG